MRKLMITTLIFLTLYSINIYSMEGREEFDQSPDTLFTDETRKDENLWGYLWAKSRPKECKNDMYGSSYEAYNILVEAIDRIKETIPEFKDKEIDHVRFDGRDYNSNDWAGHSDPRRYLQLRRRKAGDFLNDYFSPASKEKLNWFLKIAPKVKIWKSSKGDLCSVSIDTKDYDDYRFNRMSWFYRHPFMFGLGLATITAYLGYKFGSRR
jgi:hypothetical protein